MVSELVNNGEHSFNLFLLFGIHVLSKTIFIVNVSIRGVLIHQQTSAALLIILRCSASLSRLLQRRTCTIMVGSFWHLVGHEEVHNK